MAKESSGFLVAIIDDDYSVAESFRIALTALNFPIAFIALDGASALEKLRLSSEKPTLAIIDYRMPEMNGIELMSKIRNIDPDIRIVFSSGDDSIKEEALEAGADAFLIKPTRINDIRACLSGFA